MEPNRISQTAQKLTNGSYTSVSNAEMYRTPLLMMSAALVIAFILNITMINALLQSGVERDRRMLAVEARLDTHLDDGELRHPHGVFRFVQLQSDRMDLIQQLLISSHTASPEIADRLQKLGNQSQEAQKEVAGEMSRHRH